MEARNEEEFESELAEALLEYAAQQDKDMIVSTFEVNGVLTNNKGLVVQLGNGAEFQVTIIQTMNAKEN